MIKSMKKISFATALMTALLGGVVTSHAAVNRWEGVGPTGGNVTALAVTPNQASTVFLGSVGGGIYRSTDAGGAWQSMSPGTYSFDFAFTPDNSILAASYSGVFKSSDNGATWIAKNNGISVLPGYIWGGSGCFSLAVLPPNPPSSSAIYAACYGGGIYKSVDGSESWTKVHATLTSKSVAVDPSSGVVYAATDEGLIRSYDGGVTWGNVTAIGTTETTALATIPNSSGTIYAGTATGLMKGEGNGTSWVPADIQLGQVYDISVGPTTADPLYVSAASGVYRCTDNGALSCTVVKDQPAKAVAQGSGTIFAGTANEGVLKSTDGGASWTESNTGFNSANLSILAIDEDNPDNVFGTVSETSYFYKFYSMSFDMGSYTTFRSTTGPAAYNALLVVDPANHNHLLGNTLESFDRGATWRTIPSVSTYGEIIGINRNDAQEYYSLGGTPNSQRVYYTVNGGATFSDVTSGITRDMTNILGVSIVAIPEPGVAFATGIDCTDIGLPSGCRSGLFKRSNGAWTYLPGAGSPISLAIAPSNSAIIYVAGNNYSFLRSTDGGNTWPVVSTIPYGTTVTALVVDPSDPAKVYMATHNGVFTSVDSGATWTTLNDGLTHLKLSTLVMDKKAPILYASSSFGGVFKYELSTIATANPASIDFGTVVQGNSSAPKTVTITNNGAAAMNIRSVAISGTDYRIVNGTNTCTGVLARGASCSLQVTFTPMAEGNQSGVLAVAYNANTGNALEIPVSGNGIKPLAITTTSLLDGYIGVPYSATLQATGGIPSYSWSLAQGTLPTGLTLSSSGVISGTPTATEAPAFTTKVTDSNTPTANTASKALGIAVYAMPVITTQSLPNGTKGAVYNATLTVSGGKAPYTWSIASGPLPTGLTLNPATGSITGTPTAASCSTPSFKVTDANGKSSPAKLLPLPVSVVAPLDAWTNIYSASPNSAAATNLAVGNITVGTGTNRLLLVAIVMEIGTAANPIISASYSGTALTQIKVTNNTQREIVWMGYLKESQLKNGAQPIAVTYSNAVGNASALHVKWASFSGVNQTNPLVSSIAKNTNTASAVFGTTVSFVTNGMTTLVAGNGGTPVTGTLTATPAFTAGTATTSAAQTSNSYTTANHMANGSYSSTTSVIWTGTTTKWSGLVAVSLRP